LIELNCTNINAVTIQLTRIYYVQHNSDYSILDAELRTLMLVCVGVELGCLWLHQRGEWCRYFLAVNALLTVALQ